MLFTEDPDGTFSREGCDKATFQYTPLSKVRVHWTYNKGDRVIEMGYMNVEMLRLSVTNALTEFNTDKVTRFLQSEQFDDESNDNNINLFFHCSDKTELRNIYKIK